MFKEYVEEDFKWDRRFAVAKDRSHKREPGKFIDRAKGEKPKNALLIKFAAECKKDSIRDIEIAKMRVSKARRTRHKAESEGRSSHRSEKRYYECHKHAVPQYHLTKLGVAEYAELFDSTKRGDFTLAA